jgi:hypothetical protein
MDAATTAWVAGIIEGEGSIGLSRSGAPNIQVTMTDQDVIDRLHKVTGVGRVCVLGVRSAHHRQAYKWQVWAQADARALLLSLLPWFGVRRTARTAEVLGDTNTRG